MAGCLWDGPGLAARKRGKASVAAASSALSTYFICFTMVLFPDSPAPGTKGTGGQGAGRGLPGEATTGPATRTPGGRTRPTPTDCISRWHMWLGLAGSGATRAVAGRATVVKAT